MVMFAVEIKISIQNVITGQARLAQHCAIGNSGAHYKEM